MPEVERNERGWRVGENHPRATLTNAVVCAIRSMREHQGMRYRAIVEELRLRGVTASSSTVKAICNYTRRTQGASLGKADVKP